MNYHSKNLYKYKRLRNEIRRIRIRTENNNDRVREMFWKLFLLIYGEIQFHSGIGRAYSNLENFMNIEVMPSMDK